MSGTFLDSDDADGLCPSSARRRSKTKALFGAGFAGTGFLLVLVGLAGSVERNLRGNTSRGIAGSESVAAWQLEDDFTLASRAPLKEDFATFQRRVSGGRALDAEMELLVGAGREPLNLFNIARDVSDARQDGVLELQEVLQRAPSGSSAHDATPVLGPSCILGTMTPDRPSKRCPPAALEANVFTNVYPGGETRCIFDTTYAFQVLPGDNDKLLIYFQGGGACWDEGSTKMYMCTVEPWPQPLVGVFDRTSADNPFRDYTILHIGYCSGDQHVGNVTRDWMGPHHAVVDQRGYYNARSAVDWALEHYGGKDLESFVISGSSAGSLGAQIWARTLLSEFQYRRALVIADSYIGVFPPGVQGPQHKACGLCETPLLSALTRRKCLEEFATLQDIHVEAMMAFPDVLFVTVNSKADMVQMAFYDAIHTSLLHVPTTIDEVSFYDGVKVTLDFYKRHANFASFTLNGNRHVHLTRPQLYDELVGVERLSDWLRELPALEGGTVESRCQPSSVDIQAITISVYPRRRPKPAARSLARAPPPPRTPPPPPPRANPHFDGGPPLGWDRCPL